MTSKPTYAWAVVVLLVIEAGIEIEARLDRFGAFCQRWGF